MKEYVIDRPELKYRYIVYSNGDVFNLDRGNKLKPSKDKRRPNEPPAIYLKRKDEKRFFIYQDELIASLFIEGYDPTKMSIIHLDDDVENCNLNNLYCNSGINVLKDVYHETKEWVKIDIGVKLYYDYYICEDGRVFNGTTNAFVKPFEDKRERNDGYLRHNLYTGKSISDTIHFATGRLVALHFIPKPKGKDIVLYNDGDFRNVDKSNLSWGDNYDVFNRDVLAADREFSILKNPLVGIEKWKPVEIPGVEIVDEYLVSNFGRVYNKSRGFYCTQSATGSNPNNQHWRRLSINTTDKETLTVSVHRLVALAFIKNDDPEKKIFINHINGNPECNFAINLEWCTPYENIRHAIDTNLFSNKMYKNKVNDKFWRLNTFYAWIYNIKGTTDASAYNFYTMYRTNYHENNLPDLTFDEFIKTYEDKLENDEDFKILNKFYKSNYSI